MHVPFVHNWKASDAALLTKVGRLLKNNAKKAVTLSSCCGNHGEVGC
jgi:hypothetical protein